MNTTKTCLATSLLALGLTTGALAADTNTVPPTTTFPSAAGPMLPSRPLALAECLDIALQQNANVLKSKSDIEATQGVVVQTRAIALPKLQATGGYQYNDQIEKLPFSLGAGGPDSFQKEHSWTAGIKLVQSIYEGGRITSALRTARLTKEQALLQHQTVLMDTLLAVRVAFCDVLLAEQQIIVQQASIKLLEKALEDTTRRYNAGTVPRFNVLRAEVELGNAKPVLARAKNSFRIAKNNLAVGLGYRIPAGTWEDIPLQLAGKLEAEPYEIALPTALAEALEKRSELALLRKAQALRVEGIKSAQSGYLPSAQIFGGYGWRNSTFPSDYLANDIGGWNTGVQLSWNWFDGNLTKGKVQEARALHQKSGLEIDDRTRLIELEVRTSYSSFVEAKEVLESQKKVQEQADEALRLATAREDAGTGTQLDTLNAQTALTQARTTQIQALHDYVVARARLERAMGR